LRITWALSDAGGSCGLSFRADTPVATPNGEQKIGTLHVGEQVQSYNPTTKTVSTQVVQQVFINHDTDLIDVSLAVQPATKQTKPQQVAVVSHGSHAPPATTTEVVHTTQKHPWLTTKGWITAGQLRLGDQAQQLDGSTAAVVGLKIISGAASMYDLTVSNVHTFAVGDSQFVVHNCLDEREQYVHDNLDTLVPDHGGDADTILYGDKAPSYNGSRPDFDTPKAIVEVTGEGPNGIPGKLMPGMRGANQLTNFAKAGQALGKSVYLLYEGDTSKFSPQLWGFFAKWGIKVVRFARSSP